MAKGLINWVISLLFLSFSFLQLQANGDLNVEDFGAKGDGQTDAGQAFLKAWALACESTTPMTIYVPRKRYLLRPVVFQGPCNNTRIIFNMEGILMAPDYNAMGTIDTWLMFDDVEGVSIIGGYLDGQGSSLWACKASGKVCPSGSTSLAFNNGKDIEVNNLVSINSELYHIVVISSQNVTLQGVVIHAPGDSPNTDGIHIEQSTDVRILNTGIRTGDDCISIGPGARNLWIQKIACGPGHGISIGSLAKSLDEKGVENITVKNVVFNGTQNGFRIKAWARPSNGFVMGVVFEGALMINVQNPIVIDENYCPRNDGCPNQTSGIKISGVTYQNIKGTSATKIAMKFSCSASNPCKGIGLQDINLTFFGEQAESFCQNIEGTSQGAVMPPSCL
ncbi:polygalacturonase-like [Tasmannia lanceolata]|uniref:polygalacturonase-like n=1 Tax=Tasmannia lanceolata TaxID=3420 RepID=UPI004063BA92